MKRFKNISLIYECDQPTLERAALLAKAKSCPIDDHSCHQRVSKFLAAPIR